VTRFKPNPVSATPRRSRKGSQSSPVSGLISRLDRFVIPTPDPAARLVPARPIRARRYPADPRGRRDRGPRRPKPAPGPGIGAGGASRPERSPAHRHGRAECASGRLPASTELIHPRRPPGGFAAGRGAKLPVPVSMTPQGARSQRYVRRRRRRALDRRGPGVRRSAAMVDTVGGGAESRGQVPAALIAGRLRCPRPYTAASSMAAGRAKDHR
jgi:hypothetical protein